MPYNAQAILKVYPCFQGKGEIKMKGAVDIAAFRAEITKVMEAGEIWFLAVAASFIVMFSACNYVCEQHTGRCQESKSNKENPVMRPCRV